MDSGSAVPSARLTETTPSVARAYDYMLGGKEHYEIDRKFVDTLDAVFPNPVDLAKENRHFLERSVEWLARDVGIRQFIDCGSGLPTAQNVHQIVRRHQRHGLVLYIDHDPVISAHGRALLEDDDGTLFTEADFTDTDRVLFEADRVGFDWDEPTAVVHCATLHHVVDDQVAYDAVQGLVRNLPSGSALVVSQLHRAGDDAETADEIQAGAARAGVHASFRTHRQIARFFDGTNLVEPGLVRLSQWHPSGPWATPTSWDRLCLGGVGITP